MNKFFLIIFIFVGFLIADNLLMNGDFEQELDVGWQQSFVGIATIDRGTNYDSDPDYEAKVSQTNTNGYAILYQEIGILSADLENIDFSCNTKVNAYANTPGDWAGAAVIVSYMDDSDEILGETRICDFTSYSPWTNSPTVHLIEAPNASWNNYIFNLSEELTTHLTGVDPLEVSKLQVALFDTIKWCAG